MYQNIPTKVLTPEIRLSYCHLNEPYAMQNQPGATPKYSVSLLIPKTETKAMDDIRNSIKAAALAATSKAWGGFCIPEAQQMSIIHDGDGVNNSGKPYGPEAKGCWVINATSNTKPQVIHISNRDVELLPQDIYSGMYGRVTINFYGTAKGGNKICCGLGNVLKTRDGEPLGGGQNSAADDFAGIEIPQINPITGLPM